ncbi:MAG TPA: hypothetical protein VEQ66_04330 [Propionibacteriaceae bacterium]|nr:hypothetical protein [Propionibacteriaceae bacterium]
MAPDNIEQARRSILTKPVVRSAAATSKLATSLRRLGADSQTVAELTESPRTRPATQQ